MLSLHGDKDYRFLNHVIAALKRLGGSGTPNEVIHEVLSEVNLPSAELERTLKHGENAIKNEIQWARWILVVLGRIDRSERGIWRLTSGATEPVDLEEAKLAVREYQRASRAKKGSQAEQLEVEELPPDKAPGSDSQSLIEVLRQLSPAGFERLCQRLLREAGFSEVHVTGKSGDGGIDGHGVLQLNELVSFRVVFQCKRYATTVGPDKVRDFRGGMDARTDKGILLTTGDFTRAAEDEASRPGAQPIELVGSERLVRLMERLQLGVKPRTVYDVDHSFFREYET